MSLVEELERLGQEIGDPTPRCAPLTAAQEKARRHVLGMLDAKPRLARALATRVENGVVIVTIGLRSGETGDIVIPRERLDPSRLTDYADLMALLTTDYTEGMQ